MKWGLLILGLVFLLIFWPVGLILIVISLICFVAESSNKEKGINGYRKCPFCAESIKAEAKICRYCGKELPELPKEPEWKNPYETWEKKKEG